jgi:hypothetical protein
MLYRFVRTCQVNVCGQHSILCTRCIAEVYTCIYPPAILLPHVYVDLYSDRWCCRCPQTFLFRGSTGVVNSILFCRCALCVRAYVWCCPSHSAGNPISISPLPLSAVVYFGVIAAAQCLLAGDYVGPLLQMKRSQHPKPPPLPQPLTLPYRCEREKKGLR